MDTAPMQVPAISMPELKIPDISEKISKFFDRPTKRTEEIFGRVYKMAAPSVAHSHISANVYRKFDRFLEYKTCIVRYAPISVYLGENRVEPDIIVLCDDSKLRYDGIHGAPDLIVEIKSPTTGIRDETFKKDLYEISGVREYWIITPETREVNVYLLKDGKYGHPDHYVLLRERDYNMLDENEIAELPTEIRTSLYGNDLVFTLEEIFKGIDKYTA